MKHAYLIIAHGNLEQLKMLLKQIDSIDNDIFIHIDAKTKDVPRKELIESVNKSKIKIFQEYKVYWGSFQLVQVEIFLMKQASKYEYDYFHLISGADLLIKSKLEIDNFFECNHGKEFIHFDTDERLKNDGEIMRRVKYYHFFTNYRKRYGKARIFNGLFTFLERCSLSIQILLGIDRTKRYKGYEVKYGSQWFSITQELVDYIISKEEIINKIFCKTKCADELFIQTLVYNSKFRDRLFDRKFDDSNTANMRLIDIKKRGKDGSPYTWRTEDYNEIVNSKCLFARKFDLNVDNKIIKRIISEKV